MNQLIDFTTCDEIRAILGVSDEELEDATIKLDFYFNQLQFELSDIISSLESTFITYKAIPTVDKTAQEQKVITTVRVFSAYAVSKYLLVGVKLFAPKRITDGRSETERIADPFQDTRDGVEAGYLTMRKRVIDALAGVGIVVAAASGRTYFAVAGLPINPVTNEAS